MSQVANYDIKDLEKKYLFSLNIYILNCTVSRDCKGIKKVTKIIYRSE